MIEMQANQLGHLASFNARQGLPAPRIRLADGRVLAVRGARFSPTATTLLYEAGPSDSYRHSYVVEVVDDNPCVNCTVTIDDHTTDELETCLRNHLGVN
jgi:hypothetical protein